MKNEYLYEECTDSLAMLFYFYIISERPSYNSSKSPFLKAFLNKCIALVGAVHPGHLESGY